jgi:hypothetical protein
VRIQCGERVREREGERKREKGRQIEGEMVKER